MLPTLAVGQTRRCSTQTWSLPTYWAWCTTRTRSFRHSSWSQLLVRGPAMCVLFMCMIWTDKMLCVVVSFLAHVACSMQALLTNQGQKMEEAPIISREEVGPAHQLSPVSMHNRTCSTSSCAGGGGSCLSVWHPVTGVHLHRGGWLSWCSVCV